MTMSTGFIPSWCPSLRSGTIGIGFLCIIGSLYFLITSVIKISSSYALLDDPSNNVKDNRIIFAGMIWVAVEKTEDLQLWYGKQKSVVDYHLNMTIAVFFIFLTLNCLLIYGAWRGRKRLLLPWMACEFAGNIIETLLIITYGWFFDNFKIEGNDKPYFFSDFVVLSLALLLGIVALKIVYGHFEELMDKEKSMTENPSVAIFHRVPYEGFGNDPDNSARLIGTSSSVIYARK